MLEVLRLKARAEIRQILTDAKSREHLTPSERMKLDDLYGQLHEIRQLKTELLDEIEELCDRATRDGGITPEGRDRIFRIAGLLEDPARPGLQVRILRILNGSSPSTISKGETAYEPTT